jgi:hypothetical protein
LEGAIERAFQFEGPLPYEWNERRRVKRRGVSNQSPHRHDVSGNVLSCNSRSARSPVKHEPEFELCFNDVVGEAITRAKPMAVRPGSRDLGRGRAGTGYRADPGWRAWCRDSPEAQAEQGVPGGASGVAADLAPGDLGTKLESSKNPVLAC